MIGTGVVRVVNGAHDMGGAHGFGPVVPEADEPVFHAEWERRVFALTVALGAAGEWNIDASRFAREDRPPADYLDDSYYEIWLAGLERLLDERGLLERPPERVLRAEDVPAALASARGSDREPPAPGPLRRRRPRAHAQPPPAHAHPPSPLRARQGRHRRARARRARLPGLNAQLHGRGPAVAVHGALQRARAVGRGRRPQLDLDRRLGAIPGAGVMRGGTGLRRAVGGAGLRARVALNERGVFTWSEWAEAFAAAPEAGLLPALAGDARAAGAASAALADDAALARYRDAWERAAERTPHGTPIELGPDDFE